MGTTAHVVMGGARPEERGLDRAQAMIESLEQRWSRFRPTSELCRLNTHPGQSVMVSEETFDIVALATDGWSITGGRFDPTVLDALVDAGYDRTFEELTPVSPVRVRAWSAAATATATVTASQPAPGCAGIVLDPDLRAVTLPVGVGLDLGGVGKGRTADLVAWALGAGDTAGACVNLGGDVRAVGDGPDGDPWVIGIEHPLDPSLDVATLVLTEGAVTTSSRANRRWQGPDGEAHHLIDPWSGLPAYRGLVSVSVVAAEASWAEMLGKAAFVAGPEDGSTLLTEAGASALFVHDDGSIERIGGFERFEA